VGDRDACCPFFLHQENYGGVSESITEFAYRIAMLVSMNLYVSNPFDVRTHDHNVQCIHFLLWI